MNIYIKLKYGILLLLAALSGCSNNDYLIEVDYNRVGYLLADNTTNFNLSKFNAVLTRTGLDKTLLEDGPFTVLAPSDAAFTTAGYTTVADVYAASGETLGNLANYHVINGRYDSEQLPFVFGQEIPTRSGKPAYLTRWKAASGDTILTINGTQVTSVDLSGSNGKIWVMDQVLSTTIYNNLSDAIRNNADLSVFRHAVLRAGLDELLSSTDNYTVFAPSNSAMQEYGYGTTQAVDTLDPGILADLVRYHIMHDRRFQSDIQMTIPLDDGETTYQVGYTTYYGTYGLQYGYMADGSIVTFRSEEYTRTGTAPLATPTRSLLVMDLTGNIATITDGNYIAKNGILHVIDQVLQKAN